MIKEERTYTLIFSVEDTFDDAIELAHNQHLSHQKVAGTYNHLALKYHNITERVVRIIIINTLIIDLEYTMRRLLLLCKKVSHLLDSWTGET